MVAAVVLQLFVFRIFNETQSHLVAAGTIVDLGRVSVGQTTEKQFSIANRSSKPIEILQWAPTCRCMQARFDQTIVPPHSEVTSFVCTTAARPLGARAASIAIRWRYSGEQFIRTDNLLVKARYISVFTLSEERLDFGEVSTNDLPTHRLVLHPENNSSRWDGVEVSSDHENLSTQIEKKAGEYQIKATLHAQALPTGIWKDTVRVFTLLNGIQTGDEIDVPVVAKIDGSIRVSPSVIEFSSGLPEARFFSIKVSSSVIPMSDLKFLGDLVQRPQITILNGGKKAVVTGFLAAPATKGAYVGKIPIQVNNDPGQIIQVSFFGYAG